MSSNIIDIIERSQGRHALQEEREWKNPNAPNQTAVDLIENTEAKQTISEIEGVRVLTIAIPGSTKWSPPRNGRDRLVVLLGKTDQLLERDCDAAVPARWVWVTANSNCKIANAYGQARNLMIVEFDDARHDKISQNQETKGTK